MNPGERNRSLQQRVSSDQTRLQCLRIGAFNWPVHLVNHRMAGGKLGQEEQSRSQVKTSMVKSLLSVAVSG